MATHKVVTTDEEIDQALKQAKQLGEELSGVCLTGNVQSQLFSYEITYI